MTNRIPLPRELAEKLQNIHHRKQGASELMFDAMKAATQLKAELSAEEQSVWDEIAETVGIEKNTPWKAQWSDADNAYLEPVEIAATEKPADMPQH